MPTRCMEYVIHASQAYWREEARGIVRVRQRSGWMSLLLGLLSLTLSRSVFAHPMGNFSVNHFSGLEIHPTFVRVLYIIDMAEIPTFQELQDHNLNPQPDDPAVLAYRDQKVEEFRRGLRLQIGGQAMTLTTMTPTLSFPPGAGGLPTMRFTAVYETLLTMLTGEVTYEDQNYPQRAGWNEIVANSFEDAALRTSSVPTESKSQQLTTYAENLLQAPPQVRQATLAFAISAAVQALAAATPAPEGHAALVRTGAQTPRSLLTDLMTAPQLSVGVLIFSLFVAVGLGAFHALEPGHGKTLVAAYLVGSQGTAWHALILGLTVTASHTIGVYALGGVALFASQYIVPEQLYPWLGLTSGLLIVGTGLILLGRALEGSHDHTEHSHGHSEHTHSHAGHMHDGPAHEHSHDHRHRHGHHHHHIDGAVGYGALITLGVTGGLLPCPAALVVLLSAVALHRIAFGLLLIVAFSVGLAAVLVGVGLLLVSARGVVQRWQGKGRWGEYLPFLSPLVITPLGVVLTVRSLLGTGLLSGVLL